MSAPIPAPQGRGMTISDQVGRWARRTPDRVAVRLARVRLAHRQAGQLNVATALSDKVEFMQ